VVRILAIVVVTHHHVKRVPFQPYKAAIVENIQKRYHVDKTSFLFLVEMFVVMFSRVVILVNSFAMTIVIQQPVPLIPPKSLHAHVANLMSRI
jgi:hypothetical protein